MNAFGKADLKVSPQRERERGCIVWRWSYRFLITNLIKNLITVQRGTIKCKERHVQFHTTPLGVSYAQ